VLRSSGWIYWLAFLTPLSLLPLRRRGRALPTLIIIVGLASLISCGGGSPSGAGSGGTGGGGGSPQTISVSVLAQAATTQSDSNNQKILGPIMIALN
jgi:hypothetical protein